jgi:hypothetical protein
MSEHARLSLGADEPQHVAEPESPGESGVRASLRGHGNVAVQRMIQRLPNPALEAMEEPIPLVRGSDQAPQQEAAPADGAAPQEGVQEQEGIGGWLRKKLNIGHATGEQVDEYIDASPFIKKYVEAKVKAGTKAAGHVNVHTPEDFKKEYIKYAKSRGKTEDQATRDEPDVNAFRDGDQIHVHQDRGQFATTIHESMHLFSHDDFRGTLGFNANEGATEYFTKKLCKEQGITRGDFYADQYASIKKLADLVGEDKLAEAYYQGKVAELGAAVDAAKSAGDWDKWVVAMKAGTYADADALL